jgi:predicted dehydrogenase/threonine dehydrogenase-like Zn-dependent dehydrogenase
VKQIAQSYKTGELRVVDVARPRAPRGGLLVQTQASLISAGTERMIVDLARKSLVGKARERPDLVAKVVAKVKREGLLAAFDAVRSKLDSPIPLGYSMAGRVEDVGSGVASFARGDRVACAGAGYANHAEFNAVPSNLAVPIPDGVSDEEAAFVTVGAIGLHGIRLLQPQLGDTVVVIGLGLIGQMCVQLLRANGCDVIGVDVDAAKARLAVERGAMLGLLSSDADVIDRVMAATQGRGADSVLITASAPNNAPLVLAGDVARDRAKISVVGMLPLEVPRNAYYMKELDLIVSRSYGPGRYDANYEERGQSYPVGYVRWSERDNLQAVLWAMASKRLTVSDLITHRFAFGQALDAYALITGEKPEPHLGVILQYPPAANTGASTGASVSPASGTGSSVGTTANTAVAPKPRRHGEPLGVAVIGTGSFATSVLMPRLQKVRSARFVAAVSGRGLSAFHAKERFGAETSAADLSAALAMPNVHAALIATRHDAHAYQAALALDSGRHVFLEKPAALTEAELEHLGAAVGRARTNLMVGFNRRFSPFAKEVREAFRSRRSGLVMTARINAGKIPAGSWITELTEGGGRIVGEACHFIDLMSYWAGAVPMRVSAHAIGGGGAFDRSDNVVISLAFADGSVGSLIYTAMGDAAVSKERYEVFGDGTVAILDDFRELEITRGGKTNKSRALKADKGHEAELEAFFDACAAGSPSPIAWSDIAAVTRATFAAELAWREGTTVLLEEAISTEPS